MVRIPEFRLKVVVVNDQEAETTLSFRFHGGNQCLEFNCYRIPRVILSNTDACCEPPNIDTFRNRFFRDNTICLVHTFSERTKEFKIGVVTV